LSLQSDTFIDTSSPQGKVETNVHLLHGLDLIVDLVEGCNSDRHGDRPPIFHNPLRGFRPETLQRFFAHAQAVLTNPEKPLGADASDEERFMHQALLNVRADLNVQTLARLQEYLGLLSEEGVPKRYGDLENPDTEFPKIAAFHQEIARREQERRHG